MENKYDILEAVEDAAKFGYSLSVFGAKVFYQVSGITALVNGMGAYNIERFKLRLEYFTCNHKKLNSKQKQKFYEGLEHNKQNLDYLYEFFERTRTTTYDIHAKLLARLSVDLIKNNGLTYFESNLLANVNILNDKDIFLIYNFLNKNKCHSDFDEAIPFEIKNYADMSIYMKCLQLGIIIEFDTTGMFGSTKLALESKRCYISPDSNKFLNILNDFIEKDS